MRTTMKNFMLGTALVIGLFGTGAVAANAQRGFGGRPIGRPEPVVGRGNDRIEGRGYDRGYVRGYGGPVVRGYGYGYGVAVEAPYVETPYVDAYIPPCPGDGYVWLNNAWVFRGGYGRGFDRGYVVERGRGFDRGGERGFDRGGRGFEHARR